jgi:hypothetical protein
MTKPTEPAMALALDNCISPHGGEALVNIGDRNAVDSLSTAFGCRPQDVYAAISTVGDRLGDVRKFLEMLARCNRKPMAPVSEGALLPPIWAPRRP